MTISTHKMWGSPTGNPEAPKKDLGYCDFEVKPSDVVYIRRTSGGGYGNPLEREPRLVLQDVQNGFVSKEAACNVYGVVMDFEGKKYDPEDTIALRSRLTRELLKNEP